MKTNSGQSVKYRSLRRDLLGNLFYILLAFFLATLAVMLYSIYVTEREIWSSRQRDALLVSENVINSFVNEINMSLALGAAVDKYYVGQHPEYVSEFLDQQPYLQEVIFVNPQGKFYGNVSRDTSVLANMFTISQSVWFASAMRGERYVSHVYFTSSNDPYLIVAVPSAHGVVAARLRLDMLRELTQRVILGDTGDFYIIDENGVMIANSHAAAGVSEPQGDAMLNRPEVRAAISHGAQGWRGSYVNYYGAEVLGETVTLFDNKWIVFVEVARSEAFAKTRLASILTLLGVSVFFTIAILVGNSVLTRFIFKPIEILRNGTIQIGEGDLDHRITFTRQDEIAAVAESFNEMARRLQLRESALHDAVKQAADANRYKSQMLAHVSHDLRTPLGGIAGLAEILMDEVDGSLNADQRNTVERILANGKRLRDMVETLLDQAQLERGTLTLQNQTFTVEKFVEPLHSAYHIMARSKELFLAVEIKPEMRQTLRGDMLRLQEALTNLVDNAIKYTKKGGITVTLSCPDENHWAFSVADTGVGIALEAQEYIFEPFRQIDGSSTKHGGAGLGLSIVKRLIELMNGKISVESQIGKGSTFTVVLPLVKGDEA